MKKFLMALVLVLCLAFPAAAKTWTTDANTTQDQLKTAVVASTDVDTIVIGASISLDADDNGRGLYISSDRTLTLQISEDCTLTVSNSGYVVGIYNCGTLTIKGKGRLIVNNNESGNTFGVYIWGGTTYIDGGVSISASGQSDYTFGIDLDSGTANILSADISAAGGTPDSVCANTYYGGTINIYAGKFSGAMEGGYVFGPDSTRTGAGTSADPYIVTNNASVKVTPSSLGATQGTTKTQTVSVDFYASDDHAPRSIDKLEVTPASVDGINVTPSSKDGTITFTVTDTCAPGQYTFNVMCTAENVDAPNIPHIQTNTFTVTVSSLTVTPNSATVIKGSSATFTADMKTDGKSVELAKIETKGLPSDGMTCTLDGKTVTVATTDKCAVGSYDLTLTATDKDGNTAEAKITVEVVKQGEPVLPKIDETKLPEGVENVKTTPATEIQTAATNTQIAAENLEQPDKETGYVYPTEDYAKAAVKAADIFADKKNVQVNDVCRLPISNATASANGKTLLISYLMKGEELVKYAKNPADLMVFEVCSESSSEQYDAAKSIGELTNGHFAVLKTNGEILNAEIDSKETYTLCVSIKDGEKFDLDGKENAHVVDPTVLANVTYDGKTSSGSSGGCNAGFGALALAALAVIAAKQRKNSKLF